MSVSAKELLEELRRLANRMADGTATSDDAARLSALLREWPELLVYKKPQDIRLQHL